ncbi:MAG: cell division protein FtsA [Candidatus Babeliales bacterium]
MAKVFSDRLVVSIDVGTTKICVLVAQVLDKDHLEIIGVGKSPSDGLKKGVVVDIKKTVHSIKAAIKEAELMANVTINTAAIGISGGHIQSTNSQGMVAIKNGDVREAEVAAVMNAARAVAIPEGTQILHALPQYYIIDSREKVQNPIGMHGIRLEVQAHIIMGAIASVQNLVKCCQMADVKVTDIVLEQLASASAVLSEDEREIGVAMLDIGGGTSDLAIYQNGNIRHTYVLPVAGNHFTNDMAVGLRTTIKEAERIKKEFGLTHPSLLENNDYIHLEAVQGGVDQTIMRSDLLEILAPRAQELLSLVHEEIISRKLTHMMPSGLVLTGGGSLLPGMRELAEELFNIPVRIGMVRVDHDLPQMLQSPIFATGYGLLKQVLEQRAHAMDTISGPTFNRILNRMKSWVTDFF